MFRFFMTNFFLFIASLAQAGGGGQIGNGADVVVCIRNYKVNVELLDIYEARLLLGKKWPSPVIEGDENSLTEGYVAAALSELDHVFPVKSKRLRGYLASFFKEVRFLKGIELTDVPDSLQIALPADCKIAQLVIQTTHPIGNQKRYVINQDLWNQLDQKNRVATVLHEIIYRDQIALGHKDSRWTRYMNALILSKSLSTMSSQGLNKLMTEGFKDTFTQDGFILGGLQDSGQNVYQILGTTPEASLKYAVVDGRYNTSTKAILDFTTRKAAVFLNVRFPKGFGAEFKSAESTSIYSEGGFISSNVSFVPSSREDNDFALTTIEAPKPGEDLKLNKSDSRWVAHFSNGVSISSPLVDSLKIGEGLSEWIQKAGCKVDSCQFDTAQIYFAGGFALIGGPVKATLNSDMMSLIQAEKPGQFSYKHGANSPQGNFDYSYLFFPKTVSFAADGSFAFGFKLLPRSEGENAAKFLTKTGQEIELDMGQEYQFRFDNNGYLLEVK